MIIQFDDMKRKFNDKGFALIEILVVIIVIGVVATIVILNLRGFSGKEDLKSIEKEGYCEAYCTEKHNIEMALSLSLVDDKDCSDWRNYLSTQTKYNWAPDIINCSVGNAINAPDENCACMK
jgi:prepilin-type N-terminal cleavage/methylation domain-containing protein